MRPVPSSHGRHAPLSRDRAGRHRAAPVAVLAPGCGDDEGGSADAGFPDEGAADTRHDDFPSEGPMLIDGGNDVTVDAPADVSPDARDAADGTDGFPNEGPIPLDSGADG